MIPPNGIAAMLESRARESGSRTTRTVILAGGKGTRLAPYTSVLPKPLMPVGDHAILEIVIRQLARQGFDDITLSVGHLAHLIQAVFADGSDHGVAIRYVREPAPLGTAGPLRLIDGLDRTFLALNGDLVTTFDFERMLAAHREAGNVLTIATRKRVMTVDYGVLEVSAVDGGRVDRVVEFREKPSVELCVSMGIYAMEPAILDFIPAVGAFDLPDLVTALLQSEAPVGSYDYDGLWLDIGRHDDYAEALALYESGELALIDEVFARDGSGIATVTRTA